MSYLLLLMVHLIAAIAFIGTVFFEVVLLESVRKHLSRETMRDVDRIFGNVATKIMPWVLLLLYGAGVALAWQHRVALAHPLTSSLGLLLAFKIVLAVSVFGHFITAMIWRRRGLLGGRRSRVLHLSVLCHVIAIALLAKGMFYFHW